MMRRYSSMPAFLLDQAARSLRGRRGAGVGIIRGKNGPPSIFLDFGRRGAERESLLIPWNGRALARAGGIAAGLCLLIATAAGILYHIFERRR